MTDKDFKNVIKEEDPDTKAPTEEGDNDLEEVLYRQSPAFVRYEPMLDRIIEETSNEKGEHNNYFNIELARDYLKKHIAYCPFKLKFFWAHGYDKTEDARRPNNVYNERYNREIKEYCTKEISQCGRIQVVDYVEKLQEKLLDIDYKKALLDLPSKQAPRMRRRVKEVDLEKLDEQWRGKAKPGLFYNKKYLEFALGNKIKSIFLVIFKRGFYF